MPTSYRQPGEVEADQARSVTALKRLIKIGDFAREAETNLRTLRYYEELGPLAPAARSAGGFRYYRKTDLHRLQMIRDLQGLGLHLEQIRELMDTRAAAGDRGRFLARVREALHVQDRLLVERAAALEAQRRRIAVALAKLHECGRCVHSPGVENNFCEPCAMTGEPLPDTISALF